MGELEAKGILVSVYLTMNKGNYGAVNDRNTYLIGQIIVHIIAFILGV